MSLSSIVNIPVSIGEIADKLSILEIKLKYITDSDKRSNVMQEFNAIYDAVNSLMEQCKFHYGILKEINEDIWHSMDKLRTIDESLNRDEWVSECKKTIVDNDRRFRVKHKINALLNSTLKEQKGYARRKVCFLGHTELGDMINCIGAVRYLSTLYDEVRVVVKERYVENMRLFYADDPSIVIYGINSTTNIYRSRGFLPDELAKFTEGYEVVATGINAFSYGKNPTNFSIIPFSFYTDAGISIDVFWKYAHYAHNPHSKPLADLLTGIPYIFIQAAASTGPCFTTEAVEEHLGITRDTTLIIDADKNNYAPGHKWHELAQSFVFKPVAYYRETIINASTVIVCDSCFMCYSLHLPIKTTACYYVNRKSGFCQPYEYIFTDEYYFDPSTGRRVFHRLTL